MVKPVNKLEEAYEDLDKICAGIMEERGSLKILFNWDYAIDKQVIKI